MTLSKAVVNDFKRCECCGGKKNMLALGGLIKKCLVCKGVGHVSIKEVASDAIVESESVVKRVKAQKKKVIKVVDGKIDKRSKAYRDSMSPEQVPVPVDVIRERNLDLFEHTA
ncbi:MAG: hypothetical protein ACRC1W_12285 [Shewanella sp.]